MLIELQSVNDITNFINFDNGVINININIDKNDELIITVPIYHKSNEADRIPPDH